MSIESMGMQELQKASFEVDAEIAARKAELQSSVIGQIKTLMYEYGITFAMLGGRGDKKPSKVTKKVAPKWRNPSNPEQTWTGRGISPKWAAELKQAGNLDSALIAA